MRNFIWLSFDLDVLSDYKALYAWLDSKEARECGPNLAAFWYEYQNDAINELKEDLAQNVTFNSKDRVYVIWPKLKDEPPGFTYAGRFIVGKRGVQPWKGYAVTDSEDETDEV